MDDGWDIAVVGAGAAGLMAAIWAGRESPGARILALDGAKTLGAKILVAGGGRCNVTHHEVDEHSFAGSSQNAIRKVLLRFDVPQTVLFFRELGVTLKREETGKLFPITDRARTVLDALLSAARDAGVTIEHLQRVQRVRADEASEFAVEIGSVRTIDRIVRARRVILATGGKSLPKSGSDGHGHAMARWLGHTVTDRIFPALVPLTLPDKHFLCALGGVSAPVRLSVHNGANKRLTSVEGSMLCAHFGVTGPAALDVSRHFTDAKLDDARITLRVNWIPGQAEEQVRTAIDTLGWQSVLAWVRRELPERLARAILEEAGLETNTTGAQLSRAQRQQLVTALTDMVLPVTGDRGFKIAEVTAGGVPLSEIALKTMESRKAAGLHLCGEVCDVDGRIGGFNFQWAWASGYVAGVGAARGLSADEER